VNIGGGGGVTTGSSSSPPASPKGNVGSRLTKALSKLRDKDVPSNETQAEKKLREVIMGLEGVVKKVPKILLFYGICILFMAWFPVVRSSGAYTLPIILILTTLNNIMLARLFAQQSMPHSGGESSTISANTAPVGTLKKSPSFSSKT